MKAEEIASTSNFSTVHYIETDKLPENNSNSDLINVKKNIFTVKAAFWKRDRDHTLRDFFDKDCDTVVINASRTQLSL
jgi:hypothetical protein